MQSLRISLKGRTRFDASQPDPHRTVEQIWKKEAGLQFGQLCDVGLSGYWCLAVFLVLGYATCHWAGPSILISVTLATIAAGMSGLCQCELMSRCGCSGCQLWQCIDQPPGRRLTAFLIAWMNTLGRMCLVAATARAMSAIVIETTNNATRFGVFTNIDLMSGSAVFVTSMFIAAGLEESKTLRRFLTLMTLATVLFLIAVGIYYANPDALLNQPFLLTGYHGVMLGACVVYCVFSGGVRVAEVAHRNSQPVQMVALTNAFGQMSIFVSLCLLAILTAMKAKLNPDSQLSEVPLLQIFGDLDKGAKQYARWICFVVTAASVVTLNLSLADLGVSLHSSVQDLSRRRLLFSWLSRSFFLTDTPFFGHVILGFVSAALTIMADIGQLLQVAASASLINHSVICGLTVALRYASAEKGTHSQKKSSLSSGTLDPNSMEMSGHQAASSFRFTHWLNKKWIGLSRWPDLMCRYKHVPEPKTATASNSRTDQHQSVEQVSSHHSAAPDTDPDPSPDIDLVVQEYMNSHSTVATITGSASGTVKKDVSGLGDDQEYVRLSLAVFLVLLALNSWLLSRHTMSTPLLLISSIVLGVMNVTLLIFIVRQSKPDRPEEKKTFTLPLTPWFQSAALFVHLVLLFTVLDTSWIYIVCWILSGGLIYWSNSREARPQRNRPASSSCPDAEVSSGLRLPTFRGDWTRLHSRF